MRQAKTKIKKIALHKLSLQNPKRIIISLNITSIKNLYHCLTEFTRFTYDFGD